jgi:hypothetical protein
VAHQPERGGENFTAAAYHQPLGPVERCDWRRSCTGDEEGSSMRRSIPILLAAVLATSSSASARSPSEPPADAAAAASSLPPADPNLVGEWRRNQACDELVDSYSRSGLEDYTVEFLIAVGLQAGPPERLRALANPCEGARVVARRLTFGPDGTWDGFIEATGEQVDCCEYPLLEPGLIELLADPGDPTTRLRVEHVDDVLRFAVQWPESCEDADCLSQMA